MIYNAGLEHFRGGLDEKVTDTRESAVAADVGGIHGSKGDVLHHEGRSGASGLAGSHSKRKRRVHDEDMRGGRVGRTGLAHLTL